MISKVISDKAVSDLVIKNKTQERYSTENVSNCNLSCGSNLDFLNINEGESILDLGCGHGKETIEAAKAAGSNGLAVGLDITQAMIDIATQNAKDEVLKNIKFIKGDIESLPFEDGTFDAVISNCVINHAKSKRKAYSEIFRVLKNGGRFIISDAVTKEALPSEIKNDPEAWAECFGGAVTEEDYLDSIRSSGFNKIDILKRREYLKKGYDFVSLTIKATRE